MLCEPCRQRPATTTIRSWRGGRASVLRLCDFCASERARFEPRRPGASFFDELFSPFFDFGDTFGEPFRRPLGRGRIRPLDQIDFTKSFSDSARGKHNG